MNSTPIDTIDCLDDGAQDTPPPARRAVTQTRERLTRRVLATVAGVGVLATVVALTALPSAGKSTIALPGAQQAEAAFVSGLLANPDTAKAASMMAPAVAAPSGATHVAISNYAFAPAALSVPVGTTVTWTNDDTAPHTVTVSSGPQTFSSPQLSRGDTFSFTFTKAGTYEYYCAVHPSMVASVTVGAGAPSTLPTPVPTTSTSSMPMPPPTTSSGDSTCAVSSALQTFLTHVNSAHLDESPGQQVNDILNVDSYIGNHLALVERMLAPLTSGGLSDALSSLLSTFLTHVNSAHLDESPGQQVNDILNVNSYIGNHLALVQRMLASTTALAC